MQALDFGFDGFEGGKVLVLVYCVIGQLGIDSRIHGVVHDLG